MPVSDSPPAEPVAAPTKPRITLEDHARISARIAEGDVSTKDVLAAEGVTDDEWNSATAYWMQAMADDAAKRGAETTVALDYSDAFSRAQDAIRPVPEMTPEEWAQLTAEILVSGGPARPLAARMLSKADFIRLARHFAKRLSHDPAQNKRFAETFAALTAEPPAG